MFRSSTIIRELALNLAKVIFMLKHFGEITPLFIMRLFGSMLPNNYSVCRSSILDLHTGRSFTESDFTRCCINTIDLLMMSTKHVED